VNALGQIARAQLAVQMLSRRAISDHQQAGRRYLLRHVREAFDQGVKAVCGTQGAYETNDKAIFWQSRSGVSEACGIHSVRYHAHFASGARMLLNEMP
jgi:hypothetical protein